MQVLHPRCGGLDVHKDSILACARIATETGVAQHFETFGTTTSSLLKLSDWLAGYGVTHVAMEATGVYWRPVWHVLESVLATLGEAIAQVDAGGGDSLAPLRAAAARLTTIPGVT